MQAECQWRDKRGYSLYISLGQRTCKRTSVSEEVEADMGSTSLLKRHRQCSATTKDRTHLATASESQWGDSGAEDTTGRSMDAKSCSFGSDTAVGSWAQHQSASARSYGATHGWKTESQGGWHGSAAGAMCCTQLWHFGGNFLLWSLHPENKVPCMSNVGDVRQKGLSTVNVNQKANLVIHRLYWKKQSYSSSSREFHGAGGEQAQLKPFPHTSFPVNNT